MIGQTVEHVLQRASGDVLENHIRFLLLIDHKTLN